jgi:hypothetical protein
LRRLGPVPPAAALAALAGCDALAFGRTEIREIVAEPARFEGGEAKLERGVRSSVKRLGPKAFALEDGTGEIAFLAEGERPVRGAEVASRGAVRSAAIVGGPWLGLRVEETRRLR